MRNFLIIAAVGTLIGWLIMGGSGTSDEDFVNAIKAGVWVVLGVIILGGLAAIVMISVGTTLPRFTTPSFSLALPSWMERKHLMNALIAGMFWWLLEVNTEACTWLWSNPRFGVVALFATLLWIWFGPQRALAGWIIAGLFAIGVYTTINKEGNSSHSSDAEESSTSTHKSAPQREKEKVGEVTLQGGGPRVAIIPPKGYRFKRADCGGSVIVYLEGPNVSSSWDGGQNCGGSIKTNDDELRGATMSFATLLPPGSSETFKVYYVP